MAESLQQTRIRDYRESLGAKYWRNNVGVLTDRRGIPVRYGLANDSHKTNESLKSADLIGFEPTLVTPGMVGMVLPVFSSIEVKELGFKPPAEGPTHSNGRLTAWGHFVAQRNWAHLIRSHGGNAGFMRDPLEGFLPY